MAAGEAAKLLNAARAARANAYAPYSGFGVGAALLDTMGLVHLGVNVENASYGLSTCAERTALSRAITDGTRSFVAIAVSGPADDRPCLPCGSCRQILHELAPELTVVVSDRTGEPRAIPLVELIPWAFGREELEAAPRKGA